MIIHKANIGNTRMAWQLFSNGAKGWGLSIFNNNTTGNVTFDTAALPWMSPHPKQRLNADPNWPDSPSHPKTHDPTAAVRPSAQISETNMHPHAVLFPKPPPKPMPILRRTGLSDDLSRGRTRIGHGGRPSWVGHATEKPVIGLKPR